MTTRFAPWPPYKPFPESQRDTQGDNAPDFPGSSGDREKGKFRPSGTPKLTQVAVVNDDGTFIGYADLAVLQELLIYQRAILQALAWNAAGEEFTVEDALNAAR